MQKDRPEGGLRLSKNVKITMSSRTSPQTGVAIPKIERKTPDYELKMFENPGDCQKVNCPEGAREATLGCASVRTGSQ